MAINQIDSLNLGKILTIAFSDGIRNQISEDIRDFEYIERLRESDPRGRELRFMFQKSFGAAAVQWAQPAGPGAYPGASQATVEEHTAVYKEINATIELEENLWERARVSPEKYGEPLALEISSKGTASKRRIACDLYGSGTGVMGTAASAAVNADNELVLTYNTTSDTAEGAVGWAEYEDEMVLLQSDTTARLNGCTPGTAVKLVVKDKDRDAGTVTFEGQTAANVKVVLTDVSNIAAGDVLFRYGQPTPVNVSGTISADYNTVSEVMAGLESLTADDGRNVHGITMRGATSGSRFDCSAAALDSQLFQRALSRTKTAVGGGAYRWPIANMAPEALDALIESRETDRRFNSVDDISRGAPGFVYVHGQDKVEMNPSEFVPGKRIYVLPENKSSKGKVLELYSTDFRQVKAGGVGSEFFLRPNGSGHDRYIRSYLTGMFSLIAKHPKAICVLHNFTV